MPEQTSLIRTQRLGGGCLTYYGNETGSYQRSNPSIGGPPTNLAYGYPKQRWKRYK